MNEQLILTAAEDGRCVDVEVGQTVVIQLKETPTTGYRWTLQTHKADAIEVTDSGWRCPPNAQVGAAGQREFCLLVRGKGRIQLALKLCRQWEGERAAVESHIYTLVAR
jgi:inhibitor of cysteine peptidase